jgi:hypothetical protein
MKGGLSREAGDAPGAGRLCARAQTFRALKRLDFSDSSRVC